jgi:AcrR family transcriptional regulator
MSMKNSAPSKGWHTIHPADMRRKELMNVGARLFVRNGIDKATTDDIVIEAVNLKGTFYHYFKSRNELVDAWRERFSTHIREQTQAAREAMSDGDWNGKPRAWVSTPIPVPSVMA